MFEPLHQRLGIRRPHSDEEAAMAVRELQMKIYGFWTWDMSKMLPNFDTCINMLSMSLKYYDSLVEHVSYMKWFS